MSKARAKGTRYENEILQKFRDVFGGGVTRSAAGTASNDLAGLPFAVEAKCGYHGLQTLWFRNANKHHGSRWILFWNGGDRRLSTSVGELAVIPTDFMMELLSFYKEYGGCESP